MNFPISFIPGRKRLRRKRRVVATAAALMVVQAGAVESSGDLEVMLTFNTSSEDPIGPVSGAVAGKWTARFAAMRYEGYLLSNQSDTTLLLFMSQSAAEVGPDVIGYAGPSDISDSLGRELGPFADFPLS